MTVSGLTQIVIFIGVLTALTPLLGGYMASVYQGRRVVAVAGGSTRGASPVQRFYAWSRARGDLDKIFMRRRRILIRATRSRTYAGDT